MVTLTLEVTGDAAKELATMMDDDANPREVVLAALEAEDIEISGEVVQLELVPIGYDS